MKYLSLFSGIGGFELGLQNSKYEFKCIGASEIDKYAKAIYFRHFPDHKDLGDASEIDPKEIEDFDLLVGGFPCQAFSLSGKRRGFDDTRGTLFFEIARICEEKKPRYLLLENVKGLLSHDKGRTFKKILGVLSELGYDVEWEVLNSKSVGGVPQNRERLYIKGYFRRKCGREILFAKRDSRETGVQLINHHFDRQVKKRIHEVDYDELCSFLREHKKSSGLSSKAIAAQLNKPLSEVEHWFRNDKFFAPPTDDIWLPLKQILGIESDKYDDFMLEFEWVDGVYDSDARASDVDGISCTLTTKSEALIIDPKVKVLGSTSPTGHWGKRVYDQDGLAPTPCSESLHKNGVRVMFDEDEDEKDMKAIGNVSNSGHWRGNVFDPDGIGPTLTSCDYKDPRKVMVDEDDRKVNQVGSINPHQLGMVYGTDGLCRTLTATDGNHPVFIEEKENDIKVVGNLSATGHKSDDVFDPNGISRTLTASNYKHPLRVAVDVEKVYNTTREFNGNTTDGTYVPTLTASMGTGGGNVPMLRLKTNTEKGYDEVTTGDGVRLCHPTSTKARGRTQKGQTGALSTGADWGTVERDYRIRKLTPRECERLQAFPDDWTRWGADGEEISDTQRYKCLGNAVTTTVITYIANRMFEGTDEWKNGKDS